MHASGEGVLPPDLPENSVEGLAATDSKAIRFLYLYSVSCRPSDGLAVFAQKLGADCTYVKKEFDEQHDLLSQDF